MAKSVRSKLVKELDRVFSIYIRQRGMKNGKAKCVTCETADHWKRLQNGHYCSRGNYSTRWDEQNCHVQCRVCNIFRNGNYPVFSVYLLQLIGEAGLQALVRKSKQICKISNSEIQEKIEHYKTKITVDN